METFIFERSVEEGLFYVNTVPDMNQTEFVLKSEAEKLKELIKTLSFAIQSVNRSRHHEVPKDVTGDDEPCYWQRKEWVDWMIELAEHAETEVAPK